MWTTFGLSAVQECSAAIDLPQKMLFVETGGGVDIVYNDPA